MKMDKLNFTYSLKNIPYPTQWEYNKKLCRAIELFARRLRWRAFHLLNHIEAGGGEEDKNESKIEEQKPTYGIKSVPELLPFEKELFDIPRKVTFGCRSNELQKKLQSDLAELKRNPKPVISADKTSNFYSMSAGQYNKLLKENVTKQYQKCTEDQVLDVNREAAKIAKKYDLEEKMDKFTTQPGFVTIKDHKPGFPGRVSCRLLNPAKSSVGKIAKVILEEINTKIREKLSLRQWKSTNDCLKWFNEINDKPNLCFLKFDVESFYSSISKDLLSKALQFACKHTFLSKEDQDTITHSCSSFLFCEGSPWSKKNTHGDLFDVTMGSYSGAEICELIGLFLLDKVTSSGLLPKSAIGIYRDDGICVLKGSGPQVDKSRKKLVSIFKSEGLSITTESGITKTDFLDVLLDLKTGQHRPFRKENNITRYIDCSSNHPPSVIRALPGMINKRITLLSSSAEIFNQEIGHYRSALEAAGYKNLDSKLIYNPISKKRQRRRCITWFNPPWNSESKLNIGDVFLNLVDRYLTTIPMLGKFLNRNTIKLSYATTRNMKAYIDKHNMAILGSKIESKDVCNCHKTKKNECPLPNRCKIEEVIYRAEVADSSGNINYYYGLTENSFKKRWYNHMSNIRNKGEAGTALSNYIWKLKDKNEPYSLKWSIKTKAFSYRSGSKFCDLCLSEKTTIALADPHSTLNNRNEILNKCRHRWKFRLARVLK